VNLKNEPFSVSSTKMQGFVTSFWKEEARVRKFYFEKKKELEIVCSGMQMSVLKFQGKQSALPSN